MSIVAQKITYIHPDNQVLFKGIDLTINKGQKVALVVAAMYLNTVEYGSNAYGIKSAAQTFFNKEPHELNVER